MASINSAYSKRFESTFGTTNGMQYIVRIWDRARTFSSPYEFEITDNGMDMQYDSDGDEKFAPIVGCKLTLNFMIDLNVNGHGLFLDDLLGYTTTTYKEGDIMITVRDASSNAMIFNGEYLHDLDTLPDVDGPFPIQLTFTDGLGKLKEITFESKHVDTTMDAYNLQGHQKVAYWIGQCLQHTKFYKTQANPDGFWDSAANKTAFSTCVRWWYSDFYYTPNSTSIYSDPLQQTKCTTKWANKTNPANGQTNVASAYEVLKQICRSWGMRCISFNGHYFFYQIFEMTATNTQVGTPQFQWTNPQDSVRYRYYADGDVRDRRTSLGFTTVNRFNNEFYNVSHPGKRIQKLAGGTYKFLPVLNEVKVNLVHDGFQNVFGGIPTGNANGTNGMNFIGGPFLNSSQYKFRTNFFIEVTAPNGWAVTSYTLTQVALRIIALPAGSTSVSQGLATLTYDAVANTYGWDDTPTYTGTDLGPIINHTSLGGTYPGLGATSIIPLGPNLEFPGYRDASTDYMITCGSPIYAKNQSNVNINIQTGNPYGSSYIFPGWNNPIDTTALSPPSWSNGVYNQYLSSIQPVATNSATTNTIFVNNQTDDSHKIEWGDVYWGDGPEFYDDSALQYQDGATTYEFTDWTQENWLRRDHTHTSNPPTNSGETFVAQLTLQMKQCQQKILRRPNFKAAVSPDERFLYTKPFYINPIGTIKDIYQKSDGTSPAITYFFRRGKFNMMRDEWDGEWIESTTNALAPGSSNNLKIAGGTNITGNKTGGTIAQLQRPGGAPNTSAKLTLAVASENVSKDVAITSIAIQSELLFGSEIQAECDLPIGTAYNLKSGDTIYMVYVDGYTKELKLTADLTSESTSIQFESITPKYDSYEVPSFQIPMLKLYENAYRKTDGKIAGFDISSTSISKGGVSIDGFLDSDSMTGASATTLATSESIKAYVDAQSGGGGGITNYSMFTCTDTVQTSATAGESNAVVVPFDTELASSTNTIVGYGSSGAEGIENSQFSFRLGGGDTPSGNWQILWNIATNTSVVNNRILTGVKLQSGSASDGVIEWADLTPTHGFIYDRGNGSVRQGSAAGSILVRQTGSSPIYYRVVVWKEAASGSATIRSITMTNGCQITFKELN